MKHTAIVQKYDDENDYIPLDEAMLSELGIKEGDDVVITFEQLDNTQVAMRVTPVRKKGWRFWSVRSSAMNLIRRLIALYRGWRRSN
ncbi:MAG: hypothetical protein CMF22_04680 [Idiomarinaceae bacterium]|nr:hypothetical protein [Idiomarinaceae bacterium]|tara:strand:+ start:5085 stop:5345 length:261 start_codon:yes stop_codon:yes gene_type:complete